MLTADKNKLDILFNKQKCFSNTLTKVIEKYEYGSKSFSLDNRDKGGKKKPTESNKNNNNNNNSKFNNNNNKATTTTNNINNTNNNNLSPKSSN